MISDISVKELLDTMQEIVEVEVLGCNWFICHVIKVMAMRKIAKKGLRHAIDNFGLLQDEAEMSPEVIKAVMSNLEDEMNHNTKRTFHVRCKHAGRIEWASFTKSWEQFINRLSEKECGIGDVTETTKLRLNILNAILEKNPNAKLDGLAINMYFYR
jgi:hypothetical protein